MADRLLTQLMQLSHGRELGLGALALATLALLGGCPNEVTYLGADGGGGGAVTTTHTGTGGEGASVPVHAVHFEPSGSPGPGSIWLEADGDVGSDGTFTLLVRGDGLATVFGVAGRLEHDPNVCSLEGAEAGDALDDGGAELLAAGAGRSSGGVFGVTRARDWQSSATVEANEVIGRLTFKAVAPGTTNVRFVTQRSKVLSHELKEVEVAQWLGGTVTVE
jgi:hypothetical protein